MRIGRDRRLLARLFALLIVLSLVAAACGDDDDDDGAAPETTEAGALQEDSRVVFGAEQEITSFNINTAEDNTAWGRAIVRLIWPAASRQTPDYKVEPTYLEKLPHVVSEDPYTVEWNVHPDAVWDDGTPVSADDFEYYYLGCNGKVDPGEPVSAEDPSATGVDCVDTGGYDLISEFKKVDEKTFTTTFSQPYAIFESLFDEPMPPAHIARQRGEDAWNTGFKEDPGASAGPFKVEEWKKGESLTLVRNEKYWGEPAKAAEIVVRFFTDAAAQPDALRNREVDIIYPQPELDLVETIEGLDGVESTITFGATWEHLTFNLENEFLKDPKVRQAIAKGIDREAIVAALMRPFSEDAAVLGNRFFTEVSDAYVDNTPDEYKTHDVEGAKQLLADAGYSDGDIKLRISTTGGNPRRERLEELVIAQLGEIGITVETYNLPGTDVFGRIFGEHDFDIALFAYVTPVFPEPGLQQIFSTGSTGNPSAYSNPRIDTIASEIVAEPDVEQRQRMLHRADELLWEDLPNIPLYQLPTFVAHGDNVANVIDNTTTEYITWNAEEWALKE